MSTFTLLETNKVVAIYVNDLKDYSVYSDIGYITRYIFLINQPPISQNYSRKLSSIYDLHIVKYKYNARWKNVSV